MPADLHLLDTLRPRADERPSLAALRDEVRTWLAENRIEGLPDYGAHEPYGLVLSDAELEWFDRLRAGRWVCLGWPEEHHGRGLSPLEICVVGEEFARAGMPRPWLPGAGERVVGPAILRFGDAEQRARYLEPLRMGEDLYSLGFSEPDSGSDMAAARTAGVVDGDELVVTGQKVWSSFADKATKIYTLCRTDPDAPKHRGLTYVIIDMASPGITVQPLRQMAGWAGFNEVFFDQVRVPLANVIGGLGNGWTVATTGLQFERSEGASVQHVGYMKDWLDLLALCRATGRHRDPTIRQRLARAYIQIRIMEFSGQRIYGDLSADHEAGPLTSINKLHWSEHYRAFGELAMDALGPAALIRPDGPGYRTTEQQRIFLESRARCIARGTNEIQRTIIGERVLGLPREPRPAPRP